MLKIFQEMFGPLLREPKVLGNILTRRDGLNHDTLRYLEVVIVLNEVPLDNWASGRQTHVGS